MEVAPDNQVTVQGLHECKDPSKLLTPGKGLHVFLVSVTGVGEPPDNGRVFYDWIMNQPSNHSKLEYVVFGLGNKKGHPNHYNVIGKNLDKRLEELGGSRVMELGLGDYGDCIEDDFDGWMENFLKLVQGKTESQEASQPEKQEPVQVVQAVQPEKEGDQPTLSCPGIATSKSGQRMISKKHPTLRLRPRVTDVVRDDLFFLQGSQHQFYQDGTGLLNIVNNKLLTANAGETGLHELRVSLRDHHNHKDLKYETGDHLMVYPRNSQCIVESYLDVLDVDRHAIIEKQDHPYPFPPGLTIYETFSHCIDLGAVPSPSFARMILGRKDLEYKNEIAMPRRTVIDLLRESGKRLSLEDVLYNMTPMRPRYYSIASSSLSHPKEIYLAFRPVKYMTSRGILREGVCTSYMSHKGVVQGDQVAHVAALINPNPTFRLPKDATIPILMVAGGCGVAPIRAFLEERLAMNAPKYGPGRLYLGFRNPSDEVYRKIVRETIDKGVMTEAKVSYSFGCTEPDQLCMLVTELVRKESKSVWAHFESGGYTYLCGGARTFGAAIEQEMLEIIQEEGKMNFDEASKYLKNLVDTGRLCEDLAD